MMPTPRIAILHYAAPPTIGGVESTIAAHARLLVEHGYAVKIIAGAGEPFHPAIPVEIIPDIGSRSPRVAQVNDELARGIVDGQLPVLAHNLATQVSAALTGCDLLIAHNVLSLHKNLALTAALWQLRDTRNIPLITWCHDFAWTDPQYAQDIHPGYAWDLLRIPWKDVTYVVVSESRRLELLELWARSWSGLAPEIAVVPPGINPLEFFAVQPQTAEWVRRFDLFEAAPLLLLPARVTRRKNIEYALAITAALRDNALTPKLVITGPPGPHNPANLEYLASLRALEKSLRLAGSVYFLHEFGAVDDAAMRDLYLLADALLFPSEREGFGIPLLEAGAARLPIFCAALPPFRETAQDNAHYLEPGASPQAAAAQIAATLTNDAAFRLKQRVVREYSWQRIFSEKIEPLIRQVQLTHGSQTL